MIEARVTRKVAFRLVPILMLLYFVAYVDRVNIGFAALTMNEDLGLGAAAFGLGASLFFLGYFLFEVPSNLLLHRFGARAWLARIMVTWGLVSAAMAFIDSVAQFYTLRILLGVAEAGFFPGVIHYLGYWFPARQSARITAWFMAAVPISTAISSPISGAILMLDGVAGLKGWQWLFLIEALPAIVLGVLLPWLLTDRPEKAKWLSVEEREWLSRELESERGAAESTRQHSVLRALLDPRVLILGLVYFGTSAGLYTLGIWSPQILAQYGLSPLQTGLLNGIPPTAAVIAMIWWARHSDRHNERTWHVFIPCVVAAVGLALASGAANLAAVVAALVVVNIGISSAKPPLWSIPGQFLGGAAAAAGIAAINSIGNLGGFAGPAIIGWLKERTGGYGAGLLCVAVSLALSAALVLLFSSRQKNQVIPCASTR